jgi:uncharacterized membrane protein
MKRHIALFTQTFIIGLSLIACSSTEVNNPAAPGSTTGTGASTGTATVAFAQVQSIFEQRCNGCHSSSPTFTGFNPPAGGRDYTNPATIKADASRIRRETITSRNMPERNNITNMTDAERQLLSQWITEGANLQ